MELYCKTCDRHTNHKYMSNFKDGNRLLGRYIYKECGTEQEDEPMKKENNHENEIF